MWLECFHSSLLYWWIVFRCVAMLQFIHSPIEEDLECLHFLAIINKTNINLTMQAFVWTHILKSVGWTPTSTISGWYGKMMVSLLRNCQTIFEMAYHLHSHSNECCCSTPLPATNFVSFFYFILFNRCVVACPFIFNTCHFVFILVIILTWL